MQLKQPRIAQRGAGERLPCNTRGPFGVAVRLRLRRAVIIVHFVVVGSW